MKKTIIASAVLSLLSFGAMAENPSFDNVEVGYTNFDLDGLDMDGFELKGSKELSDNFYVKGEYLMVSDSDIDVNHTKIGVGYMNHFSANSTFFSEIDYARTDIDTDFDDSDDDGYGINLGVRSMLSKEFEVKAAVEYLDVGNDDTTSFVVGGVYNFTKNIAAYADYSYESDLSIYAAGLRYNF